MSKLTCLNETVFTYCPPSLPDHHCVTNQIGTRMIRESLWLFLPSSLFTQYLSIGSTLGTPGIPPALGLGGLESFR